MYMDTYIVGASVCSHRLNIGMDFPNFPEISDFMFRCANKLLPEEYSSLCSTNLEVHSYATRNVLDLRSAYARINSRNFTKHCRDPLIWNNLPNRPTFKTLPNLKVFKQHVRKWLLTGGVLLDTSSSYTTWSLS